MSSDLKLQKDLLSPPGDTIQETIDTIGMSQAELAERIGRPKEKLNDIIKGREPITIKTAVMLERVLGIPASFWIEREREYQLELSKIEQKEFLVTCIDWMEQFPILALKKMGWLPETKDKTELSDSLLKFFSVATPVQWNKIYLTEAVSAAFKISLANTQSPHAISAWMRIGELKSSRQNLPEFDSVAFKSALHKIKELVVLQPEDFKEQIQAICAQCGVAVLYTACLPKAPISGATWWKGKNPIIHLSGRYKTNDSFWFAFYHEAGHILKHGKKEIFLENLKGSPQDEEKEEEANQFAKTFLFPQEAFNQLSGVFSFDDKIILDFSREYYTHPAIIVGQLQFASLIDYSQFNYFKVPIELVN